MKVLFSTVSKKDHQKLTINTIFLDIIIEIKYLKKGQVLYSHKLLESPNHYAKVFNMFQEIIAHILCLN